MKIKILLVGIVCLTLIACNPFSPENTTKLQIQGTVTDSSDDSPISQALVTFYHGGHSLFTNLPLKEIVEHTNNQGNYFISCDLMGECKSTSIYIHVDAQNYEHEMISNSINPVVRCTEEIQTINIQLKPRKD